jgi:hypothetical protein
MNHLRSVLCSVALCILSAGQLSAESAAALLPPEVQADINKSLSNALNGLAIFSSSSALGSGYYTSDVDDGTELDLDVLRVSQDFYIGRKEDVRYAPFIRALAGQIKVTESLPPIEGGGEADFSTVESFTAGIGAGVDVRLAEGFFLTPSFLLSYNHTENNYDFNNPFSQSFLALFDKDVYNWDVDSIGYMPGAELRYNIHAAKTVITPSISYSQLFLDSYWSNSSIIDAKTSSGILVANLKADLPTGTEVLSGDLHLVPQIRRTDIFEDAKDGLGLDHYYDVSLGFLLKNQDLIPFFKDIGITGGYGFVDDFSGWRIGFDAELS